MNSYFSECPHQDTLLLWNLHVGHVRLSGFKICAVTFWFRKLPEKSGAFFMFMVVGDRLTFVIEVCLGELVFENLCTG